MAATEPTPDRTPASARPESRLPIDVMIPTLNERINLPHTLASVMQWANQVFVLDCGSTDGTQELARGMGATVVEHPWEGHARQKNWGLDHLPFTSPWILILDADESVTPPLQRELADLCLRPPDSVPQAGFFINRYFVFMGKRLNHCGYFPSWNLRLFKRGLARYEDRPVHEHMIAAGPVGYLKGLLHHEDRRGLEYYIAKHNRYSTLEAQTLVEGESTDAAVRPALFGDAVQRRRFLRARVLPHLPAKWLLRFIWMYIFRLGFLDGLTGLHFCLFISMHELFTSLKVRERLHAKVAGAALIQAVPDRPPRGNP